MIGPRLTRSGAGEDREEFKEIVERSCRGRLPFIAHTMEEVTPLPPSSHTFAVRPSFTMGGLRPGFAYTPEDLERIAGQGLAGRTGLITEVLLEGSDPRLEYELELMRDKADNVVVVCSIENADPGRRTR